MFVFVIAAPACRTPQPVAMAIRGDSVGGVLEVANGYGGKLIILSNPGVITPRRDIVRVDSFYVDPRRPGGRVRSPRYQRVLHWPASTGADTISGDPILIIDDLSGGRNVDGWLDRLFNPNTRGVFVRNHIVTIGVLPPAAALAKYGEHGRNGAIIMTTKKQEWPDESAHEVSDHGALVRDTTPLMPGVVSVRFVVDTSGHVDPTLIVATCAETPGAFLSPEQKKAILETTWRPARLRGQPVREMQSFDIHAPVDSTRRDGETLPPCGE